MSLKTLGLRHLALTVIDLESCVNFYTEILGMQIEWQPDSDNVYLTTGHDNLALHRAKQDFSRSDQQVLDHFGFILAKPDDVDEWYDFMLSKKVVIKAKPKTHRDGARSFYCADPEGNVIQMIFHPPLVGKGTP